MTHILTFKIQCTFWKIVASCTNIGSSRVSELVYVFLFQDKRFGLFKKLQAKILKFWEDLEMDPYTDFETQVCQPDADEMFILSAENLDRLRDLEQNVSVSVNTCRGRSGNS